MLIQVSGINIYRVTTICHLAYFNVTRGLQCEAIAAESQERNARLNDQLIDTRVDIIRNAIVLNVRFLSRKSVVCSAFGYRPTNSRDNVKFRTSCGTHAFSHRSVIRDSAKGNLRNDWSTESQGNELREMHRIFLTNQFYAI